jgi:cytidine deaminase
MTCASSDKTLQDEACHQQEKAHAPYSRHPVGVALETLSGEIIGGCNIECVDYLGLEAAEVALARLVTQYKWQENPDAIRLGRVVFAVPYIDRQTHSFVPSPESLGRLRFFSHYDIPLRFIDKQGNEEGFMLERLLPLCPSIDTAMQSFQDMNRGKPKKQNDLPLENKEIAELLTDLHEHSLAPSSHYCVSCVIESMSGNIYGGCNIETSMHSAIHAEETAIANMISTEGHLAKIKTVYVHTSGKTAGWPCGNCRQKLLEFSDEQTTVCVIGSNGELLSEKLKDLLPHSFHASHIS